MKLSADAGYCSDANRLSLANLSLRQNAALFPRPALRVS